MEVSMLRGRKLLMLTGFFYPKVVETCMSFKALVAALRVSYTWSDCDTVELKYFNSTEKRFVPLTCDEHVGMLFSLSAESQIGRASCRERV